MLYTCRKCGEIKAVNDETLLCDDCVVEIEKLNDARQAEAEWECMKNTAKKEKELLKPPTSPERFTMHDEESVGHSPTPSLLGEPPATGGVPPLPIFAKVPRAGRRGGEAQHADAELPVVDHSDGGGSVFRWVERDTTTFREH